MTAHTSITANLDAEMLALVERLALERGLTAAAFAADAIRQVAESESRYRAFIQAGVDAADRGELVSQDDIEAWFEARHHAAAAE